MEGEGKGAEGRATCAQRGALALAETPIAILNAAKEFSRFYEILRGTRNDGRLGRLLPDKASFPT